MRIAVILLFLVLGCATIAAQESTPTPAEGKETKENKEEAEEAKEESLDDLLKRIEKEHKEHKDFQGNFTQTKFLPLFGDKIESSGRFVFKKPDHVRWEYAKPHKSILVVTGDTGKKWSESTNKVENFKLSEDRGLDAVVKQLFTWFKGEFTKLKNDYDVSIKSREPVTLEMKPRNETVRKFIASIEVKFAKGEGAITSVKLLEPLAKGDEEAGYTLYEFKDTRLDTNVKDEEFEIKK
ncbi:MAG: outer membrane lipoprotein carrier protein LolA [Planctomycetes bacterium]|nr:outer membrane lipoprotein carrier protein LolA [Planctomycetota bacterium]